jgi:hypothetical protein
MDNDKKIEELNNHERLPESGDDKPAEIAGDEFKITVRKLELPVQPRGVLAE